jgi:hypothetical protein
MWRLANITALAHCPCRSLPALSDNKKNHRAQIKRTMSPHCASTTRPAAAPSPD